MEEINGRKVKVGANALGTSLRNSSGPPGATNILVNVEQDGNLNTIEKESFQRKHGLNDPSQLSMKRKRVESDQSKDGSDRINIGYCVDKSNLRNDNSDNNIMMQQQLNKADASLMRINRIPHTNQIETKEERFTSRPGIAWDNNPSVNIIPTKDSNINSISIHSRSPINTNRLECNPYGNLTLSGKDERWRAHRIAEDYMDLVGNMMYPATYLSQFGYDPVTGQHPTERTTTLGLITSSMRKPTVIERWSPYEISIFESTIALYGKDFHTIQKALKTKNTKEIIEFYYIWKKTRHYKIWKRQYVDFNDLDSDDDED